MIYTCGMYYRIYTADNADIYDNYNNYAYDYDVTSYMYES